MAGAVVDIGEQSVHWHRVADVEALQRIATQRIVAAAAVAIERHGRFAIVLSGGTTPQAVYRSLRSADTDWSRWHIYFGDERCLPADDPARNSRMTAQAWLDHVPVPFSQLHVIVAESGAEIAAQHYSDVLRGVEDFDLVLLGLGEDGHIASLFAGHDWGTTADAADVLAVHGAPRPPPQRVSLSAARLSRTSAALCLVTGESKRDAVIRWRAGADIPARAIRPRNGVDVLVESRLLPPPAHAVSATDQPSPSVASA